MTLKSPPVIKRFVFLRIAAFLLALPPTALAIYFAPGLLLHGRPQLFPIGFELGFAVPAALCWWLVFRGHVDRSRKIARAALLGSAFLGCAGYAIGYQFLGISWAIIAAGPQSVVAGAVLGGGIAFAMTRRPKQPAG